MRKRESCSFERIGHLNRGGPLSSTERSHATERNRAVNIDPIRLISFSLPVRSSALEQNLREGTANIYLRAPMQSSLNDESSDYRMCQEFNADSFDVC